MSQSHLTSGWITCLPLDTPNLIKLSPALICTCAFTLVTPSFAREGKSWRKVWKSLVQRWSIPEHMQIHGCRGFRADFQIRGKHLGGLLHRNHFHKPGKVHLRVWQKWTFWRNSTKSVDWYQTQKKQLEANKQAKPPNDVKIILSYSISSGRTLSTLPLLPHLCSNWLKRIPDTREATT